MASCPNAECAHGLDIHAVGEGNRYTCVVAGCKCGRGEGLFASMDGAPILCGGAVR